LGRSFSKGRRTGEATGKKKGERAVLVHEKGKNAPPVGKKNLDFSRGSDGRRPQYSRKKKEGKRGRD